MRDRLRTRDFKLIASFCIISAAALAASWFGAQRFERHLMEKQVQTAAVRWADFLHENLEDLDRILAGEAPTDGDRKLFGFVTKFDDVYRYKFFDADGVIVSSSRPEDLGQRNTRAYFTDVVAKGGRFIKTVRDEETAEIGREKVISEAYAPIMEDGRFRGAIEIYVDVSDAAAELASHMRRAQAGLAALLLAIGGLFGFATAANIRNRNRDLRQVTEARDRAARAEAEVRDLNADLERRVTERTAALRQAHAEIAGFNQVLEKRVEERTEELHAVQAELLRKERLATLGQLTATVSHELRNPLGVIRNSMFIVTEAARAHKLPLERALARIERNIVRCDDIITELLDFTRIKDLNRTTTGVDGWLAEVLDEQKVPDGVVLERDLAAGGALVAFDGDRLRRALVNLVDNAIQARKGEGVPHKVTVGSRILADRCVIVVRDTGAGMPPDVLARIFEPLFSTKGFGVGLGLSVVRQIVEQHGGGINVDSRAGEGTEVTLWLPLDRPQEMAA